MLGVAAVFSQLTREMIAENTRDGMAKRARSGKYTGSAGNPPYGYTYSTQQGRLLVEPGEAATVRRIFELYARRKWGYTKIARYLNQDGIPPRTRGAQWGPRVIAALLRSPVHIGQFAYRGEMHQGEPEPIVEQQLFEEAQDAVPHRRGSPWLLDPPAPGHQRTVRGLPQRPAGPRS
jgi:hypothetical protein